MNITFEEILADINSLYVRYKKGENTYQIGKELDDVRVSIENLASNLMEEKQ